MMDFLDIGGVGVTGGLHILGVKQNVISTPELAGQL